MTSNIHYIEIYINKQLVELESQESLNLRINDILFNPTKTNTTQATYSFSFDIPSTPKNDIIFGYANNLAKTNKFHTRYQAEVYADGINIFQGSLTVDKYNYRDKVYECNLVNIKINSLDDIFGDATLDKVKWEVPFSGAPTINEVNADMSTKYYFPLVSYGVFQKRPEYTDEVGSDYTSKFLIDEYNKWWIESFYPSLNCMEYIKRAFEWKGYSVGGSAFDDPIISSVYASCNLADEQIPIYNLGNPKFGRLSLSSHWSNGSNINNKYERYYDHELAFPYIPSGTKSDIRNIGGHLMPTTVLKPLIDRFTTEHCDIESIDIYDVFDSGNTHSQTTINADTYMFDPNERLIVIPADGFYKIDLTVSAVLQQGDGAIKADHWIWDIEFENGDYDTMEEPLSLKRNTPFEVQLVKNFDSDEGCELIYGKKKEVRYADYTGDGKLKTKYEDIVTCFPHEAPHWCNVPTKENELTNTTARALSARKNYDDEQDVPEGRWSHSYDGWRSLGNTYQDGETMAYDPVVNDNFICGVSSLSDGVAAIRKNGYSWSKKYETNNYVFYNSEPYLNTRYKHVRGGESEYESGVTTSFNKNEYIDAISNYAHTNDTIMASRVCCCVYLNKDDVLELKAILRHYDNTLTEEGQTNYYISADIDLDIRAISDLSYYNLKALPLTYDTDPTFPTNLRLNNFLNKEKKISEWINNFTKAFNLKITQNGNDIEIDTDKGYKKTLNYAVDIDDKVVEDSVESQYISYPREMSVRYNINTDEWGFEKTVPQEHINDDDWKEWGDSGYTVIKLNDDSYETSTQSTSVQFSYTYYDNFTWKNVDNPSQEKTISIPVIEDSQYMADGYGYSEAMKHDGYSKTQRFWFRQAPSSEFVYTSDMFGDKIYLTYPINSKNNVNLSYKDTETSILTEYFNCVPMLSSNYVNVETYLTPQEYKSIKGGALIHFDSDLYHISEINGYDASGHNPTELKLIKKV